MDIDRQESEQEAIARVKVGERQDPNPAYEAALRRAPKQPGVAAKPEDLRFRDLRGSGLELQHRAGCWVLMHGPARCQEHGSRVFVGLAVRGKNRAERLAMVPGASATAGGFFTSDGQPCHRGICMGSPEQYSHLESDGFTDAEAFLYKLDAGVVVATGQSAFHQAWRIRVKERSLLRVNQATR